MIYVGYFALGITIAWVTWIVTGYIRSDFARTILRAIITAISVTPALIVGHGIGVSPAFLLLFENKYFWWGAIPIIAVAIILMIVFLSVSKIRCSYIQNSITWHDIFIRPAKFKLLLISLIIALLRVEFRNNLDDLWIINALIFIGILGVHFCLCYAIQKDSPQTTAWLPLWFAIPQAILFYPLIVVYYLSGLAGCFAGKKNYYIAYLTGVIGTGIVSFMAGWHFYNAIKYAGVSHINIQGGILGTATWFAITAMVLTFCIFGFIKHYTANKRQSV